ncbi:hypothetical protein COCON_G00171450 [Conger conger]|uniref:Uncharacterized protein n=1 Tax=Conger conger TaxID=82655 RepID=A0A9Q1HSK0_CONCO|nr:hypothetical protein COCON_G00171450 [Conger conger]
MENSSVASASSEAGSTRSQEIEELERFIDSYVLEYQVQGLLSDKSEPDADGDKPQSHVSQWTENYSDKIDGSWSSSRGRGSSKPDDWEHSSNGSTGSRPSSGSRPGSASRSGSRGRNNQFRGPAKNGNREGSFDILGTDIWAANTLDSHGGATWDLQPEKLDFTQFHRKPFRGTPKLLPHIDREGMMKGQFDDDDGIDLNDMEKFLPGLTVFPPLSNEAEIAHTKKLFRRRRTDRRPAHPSQDLLTVVLPAQGKRKVTRWPGVQQVNAREAAERRGQGSPVGRLTSGLSPRALDLPRCGSGQGPRKGGGFLRICSCEIFVSFGRGRRPLSTTARASPCARGFSVEARVHRSSTSFLRGNVLCRRHRTKNSPASPAQSSAPAPA